MPRVCSRKDHLNAFTNHFPQSIRRVAALTLRAIWINTYATTHGLMKSAIGPFVIWRRGLNSGADRVEPYPDKETDIENAI